MQSISLVFKDSELEAAYQQSTLKKTKILVQHLFVMNIIIVITAGIIEICFERYITAGLFSSQIISGVFVFTKMRSSEWYLKKAIQFFTILALIIPICIYIVCAFTDLPLTDKFAISSIAFISQTYFIMTHRVTLNTFLYLESIAITFAVHQHLLGFSPYQVVYILYSFYWIIKHYQNILTERRLYQQSQINQSFIDIITNICEEKLIIFTYDQSNIKFENEIISKEAFKYFQNDDVNQILKYLFFIEKHIPFNLGKELFRTYIEQKEFNQKEQVFEGFYKNAKQKLKITLYIHQNPKLKFILKIKEIIPHTFNSLLSNVLIKQQSSSLNQIQLKFKKYFNPKIFLQKINQQNYIQSLHFKIGKYQQFLQVHRVLEQLNKLRYVTNLKLKIIEFNLTALIVNSANRWFSSYTLNKSTTLVETDIFLINILMDTIFIIVRYLKVEQTPICIQQKIINEQFVKIEVQYRQNRNQLKNKRFDKSIWKQSFQNLTRELCPNEETIIGNGRIQFTLIKNLGTKFQ